MQMLRGLFASIAYWLGLIRLGERLDPVLAKARRAEDVKDSKHRFDGDRTT